ncbi:MAG: DUF427 domain-containing protein [Chthoniobacterales bacterium]
MKATWEGVTLAESNDTIMVEGNHYFPMESLHREHLVASEQHTVCGWKGTASYFDVLVDNHLNQGAAWYYPDPKEAAENIKNRVAFWKGVVVA